MIIKIKHDRFYHHCQPCLRGKMSTACCNEVVLKQNEYSFSINWTRNRFAPSERNINDACEQRHGLHDCRRVHPILRRKQHCLRHFYVRHVICELLFILVLLHFFKSSFVSGILRMLSSRWRTDYVLTVDLSRNGMYNLEFSCVGLRECRCTCVTFQNVKLNVI